MVIKLIEDAIKEKLKGETQKTTLDFIVSMQKNGFSFEGFSAGGEGVRWTPTHKGEGFGCVAVEDCFMFWIGLVDWYSDDDNSVDDELKEFAWTHVVVCPQEKYCKPPYCQGDSQGNNHCKNRWQIFGKVHESTCHAPLAFFGPDAKALDNIAKLLLMSK